MELLLMLLVPLPLGFFVPSRTVAYLTYVAVHGFAFTFQSLYLVLGWIRGDSDAFGPYPKAKDSEIVSYGLVNLAIFAAGLGLVALGAHLAARRRARRTAAVDLEADSAAAAGRR